MNSSVHVLTIILNDLSPPQEKSTIPGKQTAVYTVENTMIGCIAA